VSSFATRGRYFIQWDDNISKALPSLIQSGVPVENNQDERTETVSYQWQLAFDSFPVAITSSRQQRHESCLLIVSALPSASWTANHQLRARFVRLADGRLRLT